MIFFIKSQGVYDAASLTRLTTPAGEDAVWLQAIELP